MRVSLHLPRLGDSGAQREREFIAPGLSAFLLLINLLALIPQGWLCRRPPPRGTPPSKRGNAPTASCVLAVDAARSPGPPTRPPRWAQRPGHRDLPSPCCRVRRSPPAKPTALVTSNPLLASARNGLDQSTVDSNGLHTSYVGNGCLNSSRTSTFLAVTASAGRQKKAYVIPAASSPEAEGESGFR